MGSPEAMSLRALCINNIFDAKEDGKQKDAPTLVHEPGITKNKKLLKNAMQTGASIIMEIVMALRRAAPACSDH